MNIQQRLRQLHTIEPDPAYVRDSRARLLMAVAQPRRVTVRVLFAGMLRSGFAMAAIGVMLFFALGGSVWKLVIGPVTQLAHWDSNALRAEAQAIDTQIHLADLQYSDPGYERQRLISPNTSFTSLAIVSGPKEPEPVQPAVSEPAVASSTGATPGEESVSPTSTPVESDTTVNVEEALELLSH